MTKKTYVFMYVATQIGLCDRCMVLEWSLDGNIASVVINGREPPLHLRIHIDDLFDNQYDAFMHLLAKDPSTRRVLVDRMRTWSVRVGKHLLDQGVSL